MFFTFFVDILLISVFDNLEERSPLFPLISFTRVWGLQPLHTSLYDNFLYNNLGLYLNLLSCSIISHVEEPCYIVKYNHIIVSYSAVPSLYIDMFELLSHLMYFEIF